MLKMPGNFTVRVSIDMLIASDSRGVPFPQLSVGLLLGGSGQRYPAGVGAGVGAGAGVGDAGGEGVAPVGTSSSDPHETKARGSARAQMRAKRRIGTSRPIAFKA